MHRHAQKGGGIIVSINSRPGSSKGECLASRFGRFTSGKFGTRCTVGWMGFETGAVGTEKSPPAPGFDLPDRQVRIESLYRLRYPGRHT